MAFLNRSKTRESVSAADSARKRSDYEMFDAIHVAVAAVDLTTVRSVGFRGTSIGPFRQLAISSSRLPSALHVHCVAPGEWTFTLGIFADEPARIDWTLTARAMSNGTAGPILRLATGEYTTLDKLILNQPTHDRLRSSISSEMAKPTSSEIGRRRLASLSKSSLSGRSGRYKPEHHRRFMASVGPVESSKTFEILPNRALLDEDLVLYGIAMGEDQELHQIVKRSLWAFVSAPCEESTDQLRFPLGYPPAFTDYSVVVKFWEQEAGRVGISVSVECPLSGAEADDDLIRQAAWILFYVDQFAKRVTGQPHND